MGVVVVVFQWPPLSFLFPSLPLSHNSNASLVGHSQGLEVYQSSPTRSSPLFRSKIVLAMHQSDLNLLLSHMPISCPFSIRFLSICSPFRFPFSSFPFPPLVPIHIIPLFPSAHLSFSLLVTHTLTHGIRARSRRALPSALSMKPFV